MSKSDNEGLSRRGFLSGTTVAGAATLLNSVSPSARSQEQTPPPGNATSARPTQAEIDRDTAAINPPQPGQTIQRPGSDLMVEVLHNLGIEFVAANASSSFEGLHESIINKGPTPNQMPELISALHEGSAVDMAHGYAKATGHPMAVMLHATVGLQNGSMAIFQAFVDKTPMVILVGSDDTFIQAHIANDLGALVRPYTKWDANPKTLPDTLLAIQEAYYEAITPPCAPTLVVVDSLIQKQDAGTLAIPVFEPVAPLQIEQSDATAIARGFLNAQNPRIDVGRLRTPQGIELAVTLAELIGACVGTSANTGPMSFPQGHALCGPGGNTEYDFTLGLEVNAPDYSLIAPDIGTVEERDHNGVGFAIVRNRGNRDSAQGLFNVDAQDSIQPIIDAVLANITAQQRVEIEARKQQHSIVNRELRLPELENQLNRRRKGWNNSPVSTARLYADLWPHIANEDWCIGSQTNFSGGHHSDIWLHEHAYSCLGGSGGAGIGYSLGATAGAALAARDRDRIVIGFEGDGDFNFMPGTLWTAAHHRLPMLIIMHNNRAWHQELMFVQHLTGERGRGTDRAHIGTTLRDPFVDYKMIAQGYGIEAEGPISDPEQLSAAYARGVKAVKEGRPYLIDVLTQPR
jgi:acetolactate synthase I/II/III large subunit